MTSKKISSLRKSYLITLAEEVVEIHSPSAGATDLDQIASDNEVEIYFDDYGEAFHGALEFENGEFYIHVNTRKCGSRDSSRSRFTIAHELGHLFIEEHRRALIQGIQPHGSTCGLFDGAETAEEREADFFAANLLMPPSKFLPEVPQNKSPLQAILSLANRFRSSVTATAIHYTHIAANRCAIIRWDADGNFVWPRIGVGYKAAGYHRPLYADGAIPLKGSATQLILSGEETEADSISTMAASFKGVAGGEYRDLLVREEAIALGDYGFMTIISDHDQIST